MYSIRCFKEWVKASQPAMWWMATKWRRMNLRSIGRLVSCRSKAMKSRLKRLANKPSRKAVFLKSLAATWRKKPRMVCLIRWLAVITKFRKLPKFWVGGRRIIQFWSVTPVSARPRWSKAWHKRLWRAMYRNQLKTSRFGRLICRIWKQARNIVAALKKRFRIWSKKWKLLAMWFCSLMKSIRFLAPVQLVAKSLEVRASRILSSQPCRVVKSLWSVRRRKMNIAIPLWRTAPWHAGLTMSRSMNRVLPTRSRFWKASRSFTNSIITFSYRKMFWRRRWITVFNIFHSAPCRIKQLTSLIWPRHT